MEKFKNWSVKKKLGSILALFGIIAMINYLSINYFKNLQKNDAAVVDAAGRQRMLSQRIAFFAEMVTGGKKGVKEDLAQAIELHNTSLYALKLGGIAPGIAEDRILPPTPNFILPTLLEAEELWSKYKKNAELILNTPVFIELERDTLNNAPPKRLNPKVEQAITFLEANAGALLVKNNALVKQYVTHADQKQDTLNYLLWVLLGINALLIWAGLVIIDTFIVKPVKIITENSGRLADGDLSSTENYISQDEIGKAVLHLDKLSDHLSQAILFAKEIGKGTFNAEFKAVSEKDELGKALMEMQTQLQEVSEEEKKRNWVTQGLAQLGEILRADQDDFEALTYHTLQFLIKYLNANQGAIFIVNDEDQENPHLELASMYAWGRKKYKGKTIEMGEGIIGEAWIEKELIYLKEIPENFVNISSGLGEANPHVILITPLIINEIVYGVVEIASFSEFEGYQIEFFRKFAESFASVISSAKINHRTKLLLEHTQQQAEEMRAQEEEMRQNLEELSATQEEMARKEKDYLQKIAELENFSSL